MQGKGETREISSLFREKSNVPQNLCCTNQLNKYRGTKRLDPSCFSRLPRFVGCHARSWYPIKAYKYRGACYASEMGIMVLFNVCESRPSLKRNARLLIGCLCEQQNNFLTQDWSATGWTTFLPQRVWHNFDIVPKLFPHFPFKISHITNHFPEYTFKR